MSKAGRFALRLLLAGTLAGGAYLGWVSLAGSPAPVVLSRKSLPLTSIP